MPRLPNKVSAALNEIKKGHRHYVEVKIIRGLYCVFESVGVYDKERKRTKKVTHYLGRILNDGRFVEARHRQKRSGAQGYQQGAGQRIEPMRQFDIDEYDRKLLTALSMNCRAPYAFLGELIGLQKNTVYNRVKRLEKMLGIRYIAEINVEKLGFFKYLVLVKFLGRKPSVEEIRAGVIKDPKIQLAAALTGGGYDLMLYILAESNKDINIMSVSILSNDQFIEYPAEWHAIPFYETYNFVPLRQEFLSMLAQARQQKRDIFGEPITEKRKMTLTRELAVLSQLNENARMEFAEVDRRLGLDSGRAQYTYYRLIRMELLSRPTISMDEVPLKYITAFFLKVVNTKEMVRTRKQFLKHLVSDSKWPTNRYVLIGDIGSPYGALLLAPVYDNNDIIEIRKNISQYLGTETSMAVVTNIIVGRLCYRRFDNAYSKQLDILKTNYNEDMGARTNYME
ncbi:MAG: AsnC family transcriptional regulator [Candidatus Micrarchaeaceae archaeon]